MKESDLITKIKNYLKQLMVSSTGKSMVECTERQEYQIS